MTASDPIARIPKPGAARNAQYRTAIAILEQALNGEVQRAYSDGAVKGGLDRLLQRLAGERRLPPGSPLAHAVRDLVAIGYGSLPPAGRAHWVGNLRSLLARETAPAPPHKQTAPVRSTAEPPESERPRRTSAPTPTPVEATGSLDSPVTVLPGVSKTLSARLGMLQIETVRDLIYHFPHRYDDFSRVRPIAELVPGEQQTLVATIWTAAEKQLGRQRRGTELIVGDATGNLRVVFFNQAYLAPKFHTGERIVLSGKVSVFQSQRQMDSPEWELLDDGDLAQAVHTGRLVPVYPLTAGLPARTMRRLVRGALDRYASLLPEPLPAPLRDRLHLMTLEQAVRQMHYPDSETLAEEARRRLAFDELLALELAVLDERRQRQRSSQAPALPLSPSAEERFLASLPFTLTPAQQHAWGQIRADLAQPRPMARLLQGDVGSGKTVVAALALLAAVDNGRQGVLMAPTEILAEQHHRTLCRLLGAGEPDAPIVTFAPRYLPRPLTVALLHGGLGARAKSAAQEALARGDVDIAVGTQALIQDQVQLPRLGLAVVDEQHRFGVQQRASLRDKGRDNGRDDGTGSHLLVMTATPIPRTLALTLYGDLEVSLIAEMPPGRQPVVTKFVAPEHRDHAYRFVRDEIRAGRQAFVICPLVEGSEKLEVRAAVDEFEHLRSLDIFAGVPMGLLHGRMSAREKDAVMQAFHERQTQILVSTAVVEVGVDVPNASVILIEGADRFGLAQLHQFRGRVGRGSQQSYCLLVADNPSAEASARLQIMETIRDGFALAEADLRLRGPGEYFGTRQSGVPDLRVARLTDLPLLERARREAEAILDASPALGAAEWSSIREQVERLRRRGGEVS